MPRDVFLLYLDRYHLGDLLFVGRLAGALAEVQQEGRLLRTLIVHGGGEKAERTLEAQGAFVERRGGVLAVETAEQARLVERATREANQDLVAALTDAGVSAVGVQGTDRRLLHVRADEGGTVEAGRLGWLGDLMAVRVVPVVSALARGAEGRTCEVPAVEAALAVAAALARAPGDGPGETRVTFVFFTQTGRAGLAEGAEVRGEVAAGALPEGAVPEPAAVRRTCAAGYAALLTSAEGFAAPGGPRGTHVRPSGNAPGPAAST